MDWTKSCEALTTRPANLTSETVGGVSYEYRQPEFMLSAPMTIEARPRFCRYCNHKINLDARSRCGECGAPEHLAAPPALPIIFVPPSPECWAE